MEHFSSQVKASRSCIKQHSVWALFLNFLTSIDLQQWYEKHAERLVISNNDIPWPFPSIEVDEYAVHQDNFSLYYSLEFVSTPNQHPKQKWPINFTEVHVDQQNFPELIFKRTSWASLTRHLSFQCLFTNITTDLSYPDTCTSLKVLVQQKNYDSVINTAT